MTTDRTKLLADLLDTAKAQVTGQRQQDYGSPEDNFGRIAALWNVYLNGKTVISPHDVSALMILLKVARLMATPEHKNSWVDIAGYAACGYACAAKPNSVEPEWTGPDWLQAPPNATHWMIVPEKTHGLWLGSAPEYRHVLGSDPVVTKLDVLGRSEPFGFSGNWWDSITERRKLFVGQSQ
jgi:Domain of unknown function (DUF6378)